MSGSRVTWADELQKTVPLNATLPPYQMQQQLANLRRSNSAPAPPVVVQRTARMDSSNTANSSGTNTKPPQKENIDENPYEESSSSDSPHTVPYQSSMGRYTLKGTGNNNEVQTTTTTATTTTTKKAEPEEPEKVKGSTPTLPVIYPTNYDPLKRRFSVCSESLNPEQFKNVQRKIIPKSEEVKAKIRTTIRVNVLFKYLGEEELNEVVDAMEEVEFAPNTEVVKQGDYVEQNNMYVVNRGELEVFYGQEPVATLTNGCAFGELALMYGCPRTATVKTKTACSLWVLDRNTFRRILMEESCRRRKLYESVLAKVPIFKSLYPYERTKNCRCS
jgi:cAMP-dependent protein kinase regulator